MGTNSVPTYRVVKLVTEAGFEPAKDSALWPSRVYHSTTRSKVKAWRVN